MIMKLHLKSRPGKSIRRVSGNQNGYKDIAAAAELAPYDHTAIRYLVMAHLAGIQDKNVVADILENKSFLFNSNDAWINTIRSWLKES